MVLCAVTSPLMSEGHPLYYGGLLALMNLPPSLWTHTSVYLLLLNKALQILNLQRGSHYARIWPPVQPSGPHIYYIGWWTGRSKYQRVHGTGYGTDQPALSCVTLSLSTPPRSQLASSTPLAMYIVHVRAKNSYCVRYPFWWAKISCSEVYNIAEASMMGRTAVIKVICRECHSNDYYLLSSAAFRNLSSMGA